MDNSVLQPQVLRAFLLRRSEFKICVNKTRVLGEQVLEEFTEAREKLAGVRHTSLSYPAGSVVPRAETEGSNLVGLSLCVDEWRQGLTVY